MKELSFRGAFWVLCRAVPTWRCMGTSLHTGAWRAVPDYSWSSALNTGCAAPSWSSTAVRGKPLHRDRVHNILSLNNIYLLTSHTYWDNRGGTDQIAESKAIKNRCCRTVQPHLLVHTQHEQSAVAPLLVTHQLSNIQANNKNMRSSNFIQHQTRGRYD